MKLTSYTRLWLNNAQGPKATELRNYIEFLEGKPDHLDKFNIEEDEEVIENIEEMNPTTALFNRYGG